MADAVLTVLLSLLFLAGPADAAPADAAAAAQSRAQALHSLAHADAGARRRNMV